MMTYLDQFYTALGFYHLDLEALRLFCTADTLFHYLTRWNVAFELLPTLASLGSENFFFLRTHKKL